MSMDNYETNSVMGDLRISDEVVANIAAIAACEVEGVGGVAGYKGKDYASWGNVKNRSKNVRVEMCDRLVSVDLGLTINYGYSLPKTAEQVQDRVKNAVENMTGLEVADVNVRIEGINVAQ